MKCSKICGLALLIFIAVNSHSLSQSIEVGLGFGLTTYDGELTPPTFMGRFSILEPAVNLSVRYNHNRWFSSRLNFLSTAIRGDDAKSGAAWRELRNLSFHTPIYELGLMGEWNIFGFFPNKKGNFISPYLVGGIAYFNFDPTTFYNGEVIRLQPLGTEGQGLPQYPDRQPYSLHEVSFPIGGGLKWAITDRLTLSGEIIWRKTFTDYLDDVSTTYVSPDLLREHNGPLAALLSRRAWQVAGVRPEDYVPRNYEVTRRGDPNTMDWYITGLLKISYQLYVDEVIPNEVKCKF